MEQQQQQFKLCVTPVGHILMLLYMLLVAAVVLIYFIVTSEFASSDYDVSLFGVI